MGGYFLAINMSTSTAKTALATHALCAASLRDCFLITNTNIMAKTARATHVSRVMPLPGYFLAINMSTSTTKAVLATHALCAASLRDCFLITNTNIMAKTARATHVSRVMPLPG